MKAIYAGSFDPVTNAHLWIINRAKQVFNEVIVLVANNSEKQYSFSLDERLNMFPDDVKPDVLPSHQLLTEYALKAGAGV